MAVWRRAGKRLAGARAHLWEQFVLPRQVGGELLWSPCNTGPLRVRKQVVTIHDLAFRDCPGAFSRAFTAWYGWLLPRLANRVRRIITVSEFSRQRIVECLQVAPERVCVVPNGVDRRFHPVDPPQRAAVAGRLKLPRRYVLSIGSLEPRKNLRGLLRAWELLGSACAGCSLVLCGVRSHVFRDAGLTGLPDDVILPGYVADEHLPALYSGAEMFVYPSLYEGFGLTVLEAMACGTPVVCSSTTSLPEVAGDAAVTVEPTDAAALSAAIGRVLGDRRLRAELGERGLARAAQFSWEHTAAETWRVLAAAAAED